MSSLSQKIVAEVDAAAQSFSSGTLSAQEDGAQITLHLCVAGAVGLSFELLEFESGNSQRAQTALRAWADKLAAKVTYLMEPLVVLEHDVQAGEIELRSQSPTPRGQLKSYYEVRLTKHGVLTMTRIVYDPATQTRTTTPCQLTREALERLVDDLVACAA